MYLIPKNIKVKKEIFKGFGILEIVVIGISLGIGYLLQMLVSDFKIKVILFIFLPMITFLLLLPLPNGSTLFSIFKRFIVYETSQKKYLYKGSDERWKYF